MRKKVSYEWDIETVDEFGDIQEHASAKRLNEFPPEDLQLAIKTGNLALIRNTWIDYGDGENGELDDKSWAYVSDGRLSIEFDNGIPVPVKYLTEYQTVASIQ